MRLVQTQERIEGSGILIQPAYEIMTLRKGSLPSGPGGLDLIPFTGVGHCGIARSKNANNDFVKTSKT